MPEQVIYLTVEGLEKLKQELKYLKNEKRVEIAEKLKEAISYGDLSENSEYEDARNEQSQIEQRIIELEDQLKRVELIIDTPKASGKKVNMGMTITIEEIGVKGSESYKIVGTTEANILGEIPTISNESPMGKSILGKKNGDSFEVKNGAGEVVNYKIISVE